MTQDQRGERLPELVEIMRKLLAPDGCPWDREQTLQTLRPYVVEEAHEVVDAIDRGDMKDLREELGDLLLQIVFQAELAGGAFGIDDVVGAICDKMVRRHPHVFADATAENSTEVLKNWEAIKAEEKKDRGVLDGVPVALPSLMRAYRMGEKAAHLGLDWPDAAGPRRKLDEEVAELDEALAGDDPEAASAELGDVQFTLVSMARKRGLDPEAALRGTCDRFARRVGWIEGEMTRAERAPSSYDAQELDGLWNRAKEHTSKP